MQFLLFTSGEHVTVILESYIPYVKQRLIYLLVFNCLFDSRRVKFLYVKLTIKLLYRR